MQQPMAGGGGGELWLVSVPGNPEPSNSWEEIAERTAHLGGDSGLGEGGLREDSVEECVAV